MSPKFKKKIVHIEVKEYPAVYRPFVERLYELYNTATDDSAEAAYGMGGAVVALPMMVWALFGTPLDPVLRQITSAPATFTTIVGLALALLIGNLIDRRFFRTKRRGAAQQLRELAPSADYAEALRQLEEFDPQFVEDVNRFVVRKK